MKKTTYVLLGLVLVVLMAVLLYFLQDVQKAKKNIENPPVRTSNQDEVEVAQARPTITPFPKVTQAPLNRSIDVDQMRLFVPEDWSAEKQVSDSETKILIRSQNELKPVPVTIEVSIQKGSTELKPFSKDYQQYIKTLGTYTADVAGRESTYHDPGRQVYRVQERIYRIKTTGKTYQITLRYFADSTIPETEAFIEDIIRNGIF